MSDCEDELDLEWEEWDGKSPFWHHCIAGSLAGVGEHVLLYPVDTVKTHMQTYCDECPRKQQHTPRPSTTSSVRSSSLSSAASSNPNNIWSTMTKITNSSSSTSSGRPATTWVVPQHCSGASSSSSSSNISRYGRLWRGVQSMAVGCVPAHALYFSCYEYGKEYSTPAIAGASATVAHDAIMTPLDTVKQRMQLGHYQNHLRVAFRTMLQTEGWTSLYRSFPITLSTNVPYGMIMVSTNEYLRQQLRRTHETRLDLTTTVLAGCGAGAVAAACTTPLDCIKTRLQTQQLGETTALYRAKNSTSTSCCNATPPKPKYRNVTQAFFSILEEEGWRGFCKGISPRVLSHTPAVAISWTTYEFAKSHLANYC